MVASQPNWHKMVSRWARIQDMLKVKVEVKGHVIRALSFWHENRFFSLAYGWIATKLAHNGPQMGACIQDVLKVTVEVKGHVIRALFF